MKSLLARLLLVVAVALVPALGFQVYTEANARHVRQQLMEEEALRQLRLVSTAVERVFDMAEQILDVIAQGPGLRSGDPERCQRVLETIVKAFPNYPVATFVAPDGRVTCASERPTIGLDRSSRPYFVTALQSDKLVVAPYTIGQRSGRSVVPVAKRVNDANGHMIGVLELSLDLGWFQQQVARVPLPAGGTIRIADRNGIILSHSGLSTVTVGQPVLAENDHTLRGSEIGFAPEFHARDGRVLFIAFIPADIQPNGLAIGVGLDPAVSFTEVARANLLGLWLIALGAALALALTAFVGRRLIHDPVDRLLAAADAWRAGSLTRRAKLPDDGSEFGRLGRAFDEMASALEARERALTMALESTTDNVLAVDRDGRLTYVNGNAARFVGERVRIGNRLWDTFPHWVGSPIEAAYRSARDDRCPARVDTWRGLSGRDWEFRIYPSDTGVTFFLRDVSEERRVAKALEDSETRLNLAREAAGFGVWDWGLVPDVVMWSEQTWRLHGYEPESRGPTFERWKSWLHPADLDRVLAAREGAFAEGAPPLSIEYRVLWPDGTIHWLLTRAIVVRAPNGQPVRMVGLNMDITAQRETESELRRLSADLEARVREEVCAREAAQSRAAQAERMQALGQLAGGVAHDFNNVLQAISGAMSLIGRRTRADAAIQRYVKLAEEASERGASITRRLLTFSRRGDLLVESVDVAETMQGLREMLRHTLGGKITVRLNLPRMLPNVAADRRQLETALVNLATNARDAMPDGGELLMTAALETLTGDELPAGRYVRFSVQDSGTGMDAATLKRAQEPFFTTKQLGSGTGLGLPMVRGFAEQSGGTLHITSEPGAGTTVTFWLPLADAEATPPDQAPEALEMSLGRILVVDDEAMIREVVAGFLRDSGFGVATAAGGAEALALLDAGERFDGLVSDLSMPGMDGIAVIRAVRQVLPGVPAILLTGYAGSDAALSVETSIGGSVTLLRKPVRDVELLDRVGAMLAAREGAEATALG